VRIAIAIRIDDRWRTIDKAGKWHTFSGSEAIVDGVQLVSLHGHTPGHTGHEFSSKGQRILFWGDTIHVQIVQLRHPEIANACSRGRRDRGAAHAISCPGPSGLVQALYRLESWGKHSRTFAIKRLIRYANDGKIAIDTNLAENAISRADPEFFPAPRCRHNPDRPYKT
jgi:glyoxylase-like metal-dependent hydrolase (beta-lactamase superfamily II)